MPYGFNDNKTKIEVLSNSLVSCQIKDNLLDVSYTYSTSSKNKRHKVYYTKDNRPANPCYTGEATFMGVWDYIWYNEGAGMVMVQEIYPRAGRVWTNLWMSGSYQGWQHSPDSADYVTIKHTGTAQDINPAVTYRVTYTFGADRITQSGYKWIGVVGVDTGNLDCSVVSYTGPDNSDPNKSYVTIMNNTNAVQTVTPAIWCLYVRES